MKSERERKQEVKKKEKGRKGQGAYNTWKREGRDRGHIIHGHSLLLLKLGNIDFFTLISFNLLRETQH